MQAPVFSQVLNCGDGLSFGFGYGSKTRAVRRTVNEDGARAALAFAAAVFGAGEIELFAKNGEQRGLRIGINPAGTAIDEQAGNSCHEASLRVPEEALIHDPAPRASVELVI